MNERPRFYPKLLAKQYVSSVLMEKRSNANEIRSVEVLERDVSKMSSKREIFAPKMTSSTVNLPLKQNVTEDPKKTTSKALSGLPDSFIEAMKRLFDLMDVEKSGKIKFEDIAARWSHGDNGDGNLPAGVIGSLSRLATQDGYLTFERFCAGIKIAILRQEAAEKKLQEQQQQQQSQPQHHYDNSNSSSGVSSMGSSIGSTSGSELISASHSTGSDESQPHVVVSGRLSPTSDLPMTKLWSRNLHTDEDDKTEIIQPPVTYQSPISPIRGKRVESRFDSSPLSRTSSLPILPGALHAVDIPADGNENEMEKVVVKSKGHHHRRYLAASPAPSEPWGSSGGSHDGEPPERRKALEGPPKPPRDPSFRMSGHFPHGSTHSLPASAHAAAAYPNISSYIQVDPSEAPIPFIWKAPPPEFRHPSTYGYVNFTEANSQSNAVAPFKGSNFSIVIDENTNLNPVPNNEIVVLRRPGTNASFRSAVTSGAAAHRRRSLVHPSSESSSNRGVKVLEEERQVIEEGLSMLERLQTCYWQRLIHVRQTLQTAKSNPNDPSILGHGGQTEAAQERLMFELKSIREMDQQLSHLMKISRQSESPTQIRPSNFDSSDWASSSERRISRLQDQNRMLTDEVGRKSQLITELEEEKRALIRQLFQQNSSMGGSTDTIKSGASFRLKQSQQQQEPTGLPPLVKPPQLSLMTSSRTGHVGGLNCIHKK